MTPELPLWAALLVALLLIVGSAITLLGTIGLLRFGTFYERVHAPTLGSTGGAGTILIATIILFSVSETKLVLQGILIPAFIFVTTPVTFMLLARAALYRDRTEEVEGVPQFEPVEEAASAVNDT